MTDTRRLIRLPETRLIHAGPRGAPGTDNGGLVSLLAFSGGIRGDGVDTGSAFTGTDFTGFLQDALDWCSSRHAQLFVPYGKYYFAKPSGSGAKTITLPTWVSILGAIGAEFYMDEDFSQAGTAQGFFKSVNQGNSDANDTYELFGCENIIFRGRWSHQPLAVAGQFGLQTIAAWNYKEVFLIRNKIYDSRGRGINCNCSKRMRVIENHLERISSDGINLREGSEVVVSWNTVYNCHDDAIACNALNTITSAARPLRGDVNVSHNTIFNSSGIKLPAARRTTVSFNRLYFCMDAALDVGHSVGASGDGAGGSVTAIGNTIENTRVRYHPDTASFATQSAADNTAMFIAGDVMSKSGTIFPGDYFSAGEGVLAPQGFNAAGATTPKWGFHNTRNFATETVSGSWDFVCIGNTIVRTAPAASKYSDYGNGPIFDSTGFFDPAMSLDNFTYTALTLGSDLRNAVCANNAIRGFRNGAGILCKIMGDSSIGNREFENVLIGKNTIEDVGFGITTTRRGGLNSPQHTFALVLDGNILDLDPHLKSSFRNGFDGTWLSTGTATERPVAINMNGIAGVIALRNLIKNCYAPLTPSASAMTYEQQILCDGNILWCDPNAVGYDGANKGIGDIPNAGPGFQYMIAGCDPTDTATWGLVKNLCPKQTTAVPTGGKFVTGHELSFPSNPWKMIRATVGSNHALGVDWILPFAGGDSIYSDVGLNFVDHFIGDSLDTRWNVRLGSDGACAAAITAGGGVDGTLDMTTGAGAGASYAVNGVQLEMLPILRTASRILKIGCRLKLSPIGNVALFFGLTDQASVLEMPFTMAAGNILTSNATDACGVLRDTANSNNWFFVGVKNDVDAAFQDSGIAPSGDTYETWSIEFSTGGAATLFRNGAQVGTLLSAAVTSSVNLTPVIAAFSRTNASRLITVDKVWFRA